MVIGGSGFVGGYLLRHLQEKTDATVLGTRAHSGRDDLPLFDLANDTITKIVPSDWHRDDRKWAVICSAVVPMDRCSTQYEYARNVMVDGTIRCVQELTELGFRTAFLSTSYVFDGESGGYMEEDPTHPLSNYGELKREVELYLEEHCPESLTFRLDKVVGTGHGEPHVFQEWRELAHRGETIRCIQGQEFSPTHVADIAVVCQHACAAGLSGCYHLASPERVLRSELAARFLKAAGLQADIQTIAMQDFQFAEPRPLRTWLRVEKLQGALDTEFTSIEAIVAAAARQETSYPPNS